MTIEELYDLSKCSDEQIDNVACCNSCPIRNYCESIAGNCHDIVRRYFTEKTDVITAKMLENVRNLSDKNLLSIQESLTKEVERREQEKKQLLKQAKEKAATQIITSIDEYISKFGPVWIEVNNDITYRINSIQSVASCDAADNSEVLK